MKIIHNALITTATILIMFVASWTIKIGIDHALNKCTYEYDKRFCLGI
jgi:hypothetical protein